jgi:hypothetical protein
MRPILPIQVVFYKSIPSDSITLCSDRTFNTQPRSNRIGSYSPGLLIDASKDASLPCSLLKMELLSFDMLFSLSTTYINFAVESQVCMVVYFLFCKMI